MYKKNKRSFFIPAITQSIKSIVLPALFFFSFFVISSISNFAFNKSYAETQQETRCYSECAAYKFGWKGDTCFDMVVQNCSIGTSDIAIKTVSFIKDAYTLISKGELAMIIGVSDVFKAWFICKPLIEDCIVPQLQTCKATCDYDPYYYSPNISVGSPYSNYFRGVYYSESKNTLSFKVVNNGLGYAWDIDTSATWGSTPNRDGRVTQVEELFDETIPELLFLGSRQGMPPTLGSTVTDFLIDESNFSNFLSGFKSDAGKKYIPPVWEKTISFTPPDGELTKVFLNVDPNQMIPESNEDDNTFILEIDRRPTPAKFDFENITIERQSNSLTNFDIYVKIKNTGEEGGDATLKWYQGNYKDGDQPFFQSQKYVEGESSTTILKEIIEDVTDGTPFCSKNRKYTLVLEDPYGGKRTTYFDIKIHAGKISGSVENLFGQNVEGATVTLSNGMTTTTNRYGNYEFNGLSELGTYTITVSHADYTQPQTKEVTLTYDESNTLTSYCEIPGLMHSNVDFVLQDEPLILNILVKDRSGNFLTATIKAVSDYFAHDFTVEGEGSYENIQPGNYQFTVSVPGFISQSQTIVLTAPEQNVEFIMTKLLGRETDSGLSIITPQLLWEMELPDEEFVSDITAAKNGKLLVFYSSNSKTKYGKLHFIDPLTGNEISSTDVPYTLVAQDMVKIDSSYDGRTVGMHIRTSWSKDEDNVVKLFNAAGQEYNSTTADRMLAINMEVSPDGTYVHGPTLMNNSLYKYTKGDIMGYKNSIDPMMIPRAEELLFTKDNNVITKFKDGLSVINFKLETIRKIGDIESVTRVINTSSSENDVVVRTDKKLYYFSPAGNWETEIQRDSRFISADISVGGDYAITTEGSGGDIHKKIKIFNRTGQDITPDFEYKDVTFVTANDTGIYFMSTRGEEIKYYKVGSYSEEYNPDEKTDPEEGSYWVSDIQTYNYETGNFEDTYAINWFGVSESQMYKATDRIIFQTNFGTITFSEGTVFTRYEQKPIVLFGQAQIHATRPVEMVLLKLKLYDPPVFYDKLYQYYNNQLPDDEYVIAKNFHTKYSAKTQDGVVTVTVKEGGVEALFKGEKTVIEEGKTLKIDENGNKKLKTDFSKYLIPGVLFFIAGVITFIQIKYRKSEKLKDFNKKIFSGLKKLVVLIWKFTKTSVAKYLWPACKKLAELVKKLALLVFSKIKSAIKNRKTTEKNRPQTGSSQESASKKQKV